MPEVRPIFVILLIFTVSFSLPNLVTDYDKQKSNAEVPIARTTLKSDLPVHAPILISSNDDFGTQGWPGSGSAENPYVIAGIAIESDDYCIKIENVDVHFIIRNCSIICDTIFFLNSGIVIFNSDNGRISNCTIRDSTLGFC